MSNSADHCPKCSHSAAFHGKDGCEHEACTCEESPETIHKLQTAAAIKRAKGLRFVVGALFVLCAVPAWTKPTNKSAVIKVLKVISERVCVPQVPSVLESGVLCGEGSRIVAESKDFYIEAVCLHGQIVPSLGEHFAAILPGNFLSIVDSGNADTAKIVSSFNVEVFRPKQEGDRHF
jgi:hypothetical protein